MASMMKNIVGSRIRGLRNRQGRKISQQELAARLQALGIEIDQTTISRIENGERLVTDIEVLALCRALGVDISALFEDLTDS